MFRIKALLTPQRDVLLLKVKNDGIGEILTHKGSLVSLFFPIFALHYVLVLVVVYASCDIDNNEN